MKKSAQRTTTPFSKWDHGVLSPTTDKSRTVPLFGDTPLIQDILMNNPNGGRDFRLNGGGDWSADDHQGKAYREKGEDYKIVSKIIEMMKRNPHPLKDESWIGLDYDGKRHEFPSYEALQRRLRKGDIVFRSVSKLAQADNFIARSLKACVMVESTEPSGQSKEIGAAFAIGGNLFITCAHVIRRYDKARMPDRLDAEGCQILLRQNGKTAPATFVAADPKMDLAVIRSEFPAAPLSLGTSHSLPVGSSVFAIGSPSGFENNLSEGVVSSHSRRVFFYPKAPLYLFTDAQVLPGSSGGPLVSYDDRKVVGMISLIVGGQGLYGLNAALPAEYISQFLTQNGIQ